MARRRRRRRNPTRKQWLYIGLGAVAAAGAGGGIYYLVKRRRTALGPGSPFVNLPPPPKEGVGAPVSADSCGREYPGFVFQDGGCVATSRTPAGIYVVEGCSDFVFVAGEEGTQPDFIADMVLTAVDGSAGPTAPSANPIRMAGNFLTEFWPECSWPPSPTASPRIIHMFSALCYLMAREVVSAGGWVLGTDALDVVDELVAEQLASMGYPDFDPDIVPELNIADNEEHEPLVPTEPAEDPTEVPQFEMPQGSELLKHFKPGVGWHTIVIVPRKDQSPALGQTVIVWDWWAWTPGVVLAKSTAFRHGKEDSPQQAAAVAKDTIDAYFVAKGEMIQ